MSRPAARPTERVHRVGMAEESDGSCVALRMKRGREGERNKWTGEGDGENERRVSLGNTVEGSSIF